MNLIDDITLVTISSLFGVIIGKQSILNVVDFFYKRKLKKTLEILETYPMLHEFDEVFNSEFIIPYLQELHFSAETGIQTNEKSIYKYINFKNKLGANFTWLDIKMAKMHLDLNSEEIK
jgi:hypothetical protein